MGGDTVGDGVETGAGCPDLYAHMRYRVRWDGRYVAGVNHVSGLLRGLPGGRRADGQPALPPSVAPTPTHWLPVVLERGLTRDPEFVAWAARQAASPRAQADHPSADDDRRELVIELCNERGQLVVSYVVHRAWVEGYESLAVDDQGTVALIERLVLAHDGWERDIDSAQPAAAG